MFKQDFERCWENKSLWKCVLLFNSQHNETLKTGCLQCLLNNICLHFRGLRKANVANLILFYMKC